MIKRCCFVENGYLYRTKRTCECTFALNVLLEKGIFYDDKEALPHIASAYFAMDKPYGMGSRESENK